MHIFIQYQFIVVMIIMINGSNNSNMIHIYVCVCIVMAKCRPIFLILKEFMLSCKRSCSYELKISGCMVSSVYEEANERSLYPDRMIIDVPRGWVAINIVVGVYQPISTGDIS